LCPATCAVRRAAATFLPHAGHDTQHGAGWSTASGARWQRQSHVSPGGGVGTNFMNARSRLGRPRMPHCTFGTIRAEAAGINVGARLRVKQQSAVIPSEARAQRRPGAHAVGR